MPSSRNPVRLLHLFPGDWEREAMVRLVRSGECVVHTEGRALGRGVGALRALFLDAHGFVDRICRDYAGSIDAVWSTNEQFGCLIAAVVGARLGLPQNPPKAIVAAQHKLALRKLLAARMPQATVRAAVLPWQIRDRRSTDAGAVEAAVAASGLQWPVFAKPVKATFSVLARRLQSAAEFEAHMRMPAIDGWMLSRLVRPFDQLATDLGVLPCTSDRALVEEPIAGLQVNVDGYFVGGQLHWLGVVDSCMYPGEVAGARHFSAFVYPSALPAQTQQRLRDVAAAVVTALGLRHGLFNVELFLTESGDIKVIEVNPRAAGQFATLYRSVDGVDLERLAVRLAAGLSVPPRLAPTAGVAGSFAFRRFDGGEGAVPGLAARHWLNTRFPDARLWLKHCAGPVRRREYRWTGSHRYAVLNHAAADLPTLLRQVDECARRLFGVAHPDAA